MQIGTLLQIEGRRFRLRTAAAGMWLALGAAGCGGNGDDGDADSSAPDAADRDTSAAASAEETLPTLGTFAPPDEPLQDSAQGRGPGEGDSAIYVPNTTLFPGMARLDPAIENPYVGAEAIAAGERHFAAFNCAGCHAPLAGGGMGPPLSDDEWIHGSEPAQIYLSIMHGRPDGMPAWSAMLPRRTVWEIVAYIDTLDEIDDYAAELGFDTNVDRFAGVDEEDLPWLAPNATNADAAQDTDAAQNGDAAQDTDAAQNADAAQQ